MKKFLAGLMVLMLVVGIIGYLPVSADTSTGDTKVKLNKTSVSIKVGKSKTLKLQNAPKKEVTWTSSDNSIARVSAKGKVTGESKGTVTITATYKGKDYDCKVKVKGTKVASYLNADGMIYTTALPSDWSLLYMDTNGMVGWGLPSGCIAMTGGFSFNSANLEKYQEAFSDEEYSKAMYGEMLKKVGSLGEFSKECTVTKNKETGYYTIEGDINQLKIGEVDVSGKLFVALTDNKITLIMLVNLKDLGVPESDIKAVRKLIKTVRSREVY